jgi:hypothetical protein
MRLGCFLLSSLLLLSGVSLAEPKPATPISATAQVSYQKALKQGRALHKKKKYPEAVAAFQEALKAIPDDPRALSELGYAAYFDKDFALARESTQKSIDLSADANIKAASLYNLGLIYEATSEDKKAAESYLASLRLRENDTVISRLKTLDPALVTSYLGIVPEALDAFSSLEELCQHTVSDDSGYGDEPESQQFRTALDDCINGFKKEELKAAGSPFLLAGVTTIFSVLYKYRLIIKTNAGWFTLKNTFFEGYLGMGTSGSELWETSFSVESGGSAEWLVFRYKTLSFENDYPDDEDNTDGFKGVDSYLTVCAANSAGAPSCIAPIQIGSLKEVTKKGKTKSTSWKLEAAITADGVLELKSSNKKLDPQAARFSGKHNLNFP